MAAGAEEYDVAHGMTATAGLRLGQPAGEPSIHPSILPAPAAGPTLLMDFGFLLGLGD